MKTQKVLRGIELRYFVTFALENGGPMTVADLGYELNRQGFTVDGRPSKAISDALRWEVNLGRAVRVAHGCYGPGFMPRSTSYRIAHRVADLRAQARRSTAEPDDDDWLADWPGG